MQVFTGRTDEESFRDTLDGFYHWPCTFTFKFIVNRRDFPAILDLFADDAVRTRHSARGRYIALTVERQVGSSDEVVDVYRQAWGAGSVMAL